MLLKSGTSIAVITLYASHVLAIPYDSYPSTITTGTTTNNDESNNGILDELGSGILRVWDAITCSGDCRKSWGWTGNHFGADPWGGVLKVGDPIPYVPDVSVHSNPTTTLETTGTSATGRFGILDITTNANSPAQTSVAFSVFNVPTLARSSSTTSTTPTSTPPPPTTTTESPSPTPTPEPETTQQPEPEPEPTTNSPEQPAPSNTNNNNNSNNNTPVVVPNTGNQGLSSDQAAYLAAHNSARAQHGASPVTWSTELEGFAQQWANNCQFKHSGGIFGRVGENLAAGTGNYGISDMVGDWMAEVTEYNPSNPVASHFTQVVWKATTQIGCAKATCNGIFQGFGASTYYVCEYSEAGNVSGQFSANVQK